jgi:hypothetical protein
LAGVFVFERGAPPVDFFERGSDGAPTPPLRFDVFVAASAVDAAETAPDTTRSASKVDRKGRILGSSFVM